MNLVPNIEIHTLEEEFGDLLRKLYDNKEFLSYKVEITDIKDGKNFLEHLKKYESTFIPYQVLTEFVYDPEENKEISQFAEILYSSIFKNEAIDDEIKNKTLKIRQHLLLAEQQKQSLYLEQQDKLEDLNKNIVSLKNELEKTKNELEESKDDLEESKNKLKENKSLYDNMLSQYISILGIFAAILMTAFGGIQVFNSLFKNNKFNLDNTILLSCFGFLGVLLLIFMLLNSIAKMTNKKIDSNTDFNKWYLRHRTLANSFVILTTIISIIVVKKIIAIDNFKFKGSYLLYLLPFLYAIKCFRYFNGYKSKWYFLKLF